MQGLGSEGWICGGGEGALPLCMVSGGKEKVVTFYHFTILPCLKANILTPHYLSLPYHASVTEHEPTSPDCIFAHAASRTAAFTKSSTHSLLLAFGLSSFSFIYSLSLTIPVGGMWWHRARHPLSVFHRYYSRPA